MRECCVCRLLALGQDPLQAVSGARLHHQLLPDLVRAEHWNVSVVTGPSFKVTNAEVEVHIPAQLPSCASLLSKSVQVLRFARLNLSVYFLSRSFYRVCCHGCNASATMGLELAAQALSWL